MCVKNFICMPLLYVLIHLYVNTPFACQNPICMSKSHLYVTTSSVYQYFICMSLLASVPETIFTYQLCPVSVWKLTKEIFVQTCKRKKEVKCELERARILDQSKFHSYTCIYQNDISLFD